MGLGMALLGSVALATACDEAALAHDAMEVLKAHFDLELGAVAAGPTSVAGFQHLKTADALLAAQALAHDDFERAADQFRCVLIVNLPVYLCVSWFALTRGPLQSAAQVRAVQWQPTATRGVRAVGAQGLDLARQQRHVLPGACILEPDGQEQPRGHLQRRSTAHRG